jgi:drug/metabolite transporter (DMT)-like permease
MSLGLIFLVLFAAALHAAWNAIVKSSPDKSSDVVLVAASAALIAGVTLPFIAIPAAASWPYLAASVAIHLLYFSLVGLAYRHGDLSYAYPLMRGSAPLITACAASLVVGEVLKPGGYLGVFLLSAGILVLAADGLRYGKAHLGTTCFGLANAVVVALYTVVDGLGVRLAWQCPLVCAVVVLSQRVPAADTGARDQARISRCSGAALGRWSGGRVHHRLVRPGVVGHDPGPLALVAALRETAVIFGTVFAAAFLGESLGWRYLAAALVTAGAIAMKVLRALKGEDEPPHPTLPQ